MSSLGGQAPDYGGRVELRLQSLNATTARYDATLGAAGEQWTLQAEVAIESGKVSFGEPEPAAPPAWLRDFAEALLRAAWRTRAAQPWPRRITRWRSAKDKDSDA